MTYSYLYKRLKAEDPAPHWAGSDQQQKNTCRSRSLGPTVSLLPCKPCYFTTSVQNLAFVLTEAGRSSTPSASSRQRFHATVARSKFTSYQTNKIFCANVAQWCMTKKREVAVVLLWMPGKVAKRLGVPKGLKISPGVKEMREFGFQGGF